MHRYFLFLLIAALATPSSINAQKEPKPVRPAAIAAGRYGHADAHADATPESAERSVADLATYLAEVGSDDLTRARAVYRWITGNIDYDVNGLSTGSYGDLSPSGVLRRRSAVCSGYAQLAEALGEAMGLDMEVVNGWSKGYGYTAGQRFDGPTNHAWNAVRIDGEWQLMDATWGAGYLNERMRFTRLFQEHYFLTEPEAFVFDHLPRDQRWQLLDRPVSAEDYADLAYLRPMFFQAGLQIKSHARVHIATKNRLLVTLGVANPVHMAAQVVDAASDTPLSDEMAFLQVSEREAQVHAVFPKPGDYVLRLFAKPLGAEGTLQWVLDYRIKASRGLPDASFPTAFGNFGARRVWLVEPLDGILEVGRTYRFRLRVPGALQVAVVANGEWTYFTDEANEFSTEFTAVRGAMTVYAKFDPEAQFWGLLRYTGR